MWHSSGGHENASGVDSPGPEALGPFLYASPELKFHEVEPLLSLQYRLCLVVNFLGRCIPKLLITVHDVLLDCFMEYIHFSRGKLPCADTSFK